MNKIKIMVATVFSILILISFVFIYTNGNSNDEIIESVEDKTVLEVENIVEEKKSFFIDVKGAVKKQGVYEVSEGMIVNDAIKLAGGIKNNGTTANINLSQELSKGMVIYVSTKGELTTTSIVFTTMPTTSIIDFNIPNVTEVSDSRVNINLDSKERLITLTGIGESKADAIIEYRKKTPFEKIEDIMNISGIGESAFEKIKDNIKV